MKLIKLNKSGSPVECLYIPTTNTCYYKPATNACCYRYRSNICCCRPKISIFVWAYD